MPALSIRQPAAAALVAPPGPFELPGWETDYRGPLLIHASSRGERRPARRPGRAPGVRCPDRPGGPDGLRRHRTHRRRPDEVGYVWVFANPRPFAHPVPYTGRMGMFHVSEEVVADSLAALKG